MNITKYWSLGSVQIGLQLGLIGSWQAAVQFVFKAWTTKGDAFAVHRLRIELPFIRFYYYWFSLA